MEACLVAGREVIQIDIGIVGVEKLSTAIEDIGGDSNEAQVVSSVVLDFANDM